MKMNRFCEGKCFYISKQCGSHGKICI